MNGDHPHPPIALMEAIDTHRVAASEPLRAAARRFRVAHEAFRSTITEVKIGNPEFQSFDMENWDVDLLTIAEVDDSMEEIVREFLQNPALHSETEAIVAIQRSVDARRPWTRFTR